MGNDNQATTKLPKFPEEFHWSYGGEPRGYKCLQITVPDLPNESNKWKDNFFCWLDKFGDLDFFWSPSGKMRGMTCIEIVETDDPLWRDHDNYLCYNPAYDYKFKWSESGQLSSLKCL